LTEGSNPAAWRPARARLGVVGRAHGLDGSFRVEGAVDWFAFAPGALLELGGEPRRIATRRGDDARPIVRLAGVESREAAEALRGSVLELEMAALPEPEAEAFYVFDLVGCEVMSAGARIGVVRDVLDRPANDVLVVDRGGEELLVPFIREAVPSIDVEGRRIEVDPAFVEEGPAA
jgi:16S rRNA processing protein RimM